jgi:hypothetical protein
MFSIRSPRQHDKLELVFLKENGVKGNPIPMQNSTSEEEMLAVYAEASIC